MLEKKVKSIIVEFNSWKSCQQFYHARPKQFNNSKRKPGQLLFSVSVDLTRRQYLLLNKAKGLTKDCESINYVFVDVNCSLGMKFQNGVFKYFNSENKLHCLINNLIIRSSHSNIYVLQLLQQFCLFVFSFTLFFFFRINPMTASSKSICRSHQYMITK